MWVEVLNSTIYVSRMKGFPMKILLPLVDVVDIKNAEELVKFIGAVCNLKMVGKNNTEIRSLVGCAYTNND